jgi:group I intron endonuclease
LPSQFLIYCLKDIAGNICYVGKSSNGKECAMRHFREKLYTKMKSPLYLWIHSLVATGYFPSVFILEYVDSKENLDQRERHWIAELKNQGIRLLNVQTGGKNLGGYKLSAEHREKIRLSLIGNKRLVMTDEMRKKISLSRIGNTRPVRGPISDETRKKMSLSKKGKKLSEKVRSNMSAAMKKRGITPEHRKNIQIAFNLKKAKKLELSHDQI